jgi:predicted TIM-barrel fold metal-dependent hydrolase
VIDVNTFVGPYPFRHVGRAEPEVLLEVLERERLDGAWVGHLPSAFYRDPTAGNAKLFAGIAQFEEILRPVPTIRPDWPRWEAAVRQAADAGAPAVRIYPQLWGLGPDDPGLRELAIACGERGIATLLTVRFEDSRQRHPLDLAGDLEAATVRSLARAGNGVRLVVTAAGREFIEEVHWGLTVLEQQRVYWDFSWIWGPPEDHFAKLLRAVGSSRFVYGSQWPLRLPELPRANLDLLPADVSEPKLDVATVFVV